LFFCIIKDLKKIKTTKGKKIAQIIPTDAERLFLKLKNNVYLGKCFCVCVPISNFYLLAKDRCFFVCFFYFLYYLEEISPIL